MYYLGGSFSRLTSFLLDVTGLGDTFGCLLSLFNFGAFMKPVSRHSVNKRHSARQFGRHTRTVAAANMALNPMRGGWRL
jgi:hypothetical protein